MLKKVKIVLICTTFVIQTSCMSSVCEKTCCPKPGHGPCPICVPYE